MQSDPRNHLYLHYLNFLSEFKPEIFVFENVPGLTSAKNGEIYSDFYKKIQNLGYKLNPKPEILNAKNFGVLQERKRIICVGIKKEHDSSSIKFGNYVSKYSINDLFQDLPLLEPGMGIDGSQPYEAIMPSKYLKEAQIRNDEKSVRHHFARPHNDRDREIYRIAIKKWTEYHQRLHYDQLPDHLKTHKNQSSFLDRFKVVNGNGISHAIVAHLSKDGHYFIHPDISQARSITVREAARIQSFPDNFLFEGPMTAKFIQIGNAVPPLMAEGIAREIKKIISGIY